MLSELLYQGREHSLFSSLLPIPSVDIMCRSPLSSGRYCVLQARTSISLFFANLALATAMYFWIKLNLSPLKEKGVILWFENRLNRVKKTRVILISREGRRSDLLRKRFKIFRFVGGTIQHKFPSSNPYRFVQFRLLCSRSAAE